ncbi:hypothetical protein HYC85_020973 [Camellia sinensis]|uniref:Uncharacterized protein n=1 Tax=Camellia sinensis TaxID=4442 RepID=A0A7J7GK54_CAMSI|nr:hypothetical protein HYC85_020973 [Camellia sinensis]
MISSTVVAKCLQLQQQQRPCFFCSRQNICTTVSATAISFSSKPQYSSSSSSSSHIKQEDHHQSPLFSPLILPTINPNSIRSTLTVKSSHFNLPLISPHDQWGTWTALFSVGAFGRSEKTKIGSTLSGALVSTLVGLAASNLGIISSEAPAYAIVLEFLLPMAVPLLLFRADLRRVIKSTGTLLLAFLLGSVATTIGTAVAFLMVPMRSLGQDSWKIAAALMGRHIGGVDFRKGWHGWERGLNSLTRVAEEKLGRVGRKW